MRLILHRHASTEKGTLGWLERDGIYECGTLEPAEPIPAGEYPISLYQSPKFHTQVPLLHDVPGHTWIEIHVGNTIRDTTGCILVGQPDRPAVAVYNSRVAFDALVPKIRAALELSPVTLRIVPHE